LGTHEAHQQDSACSVEVFARMLTLPPLARLLFRLVWMPNDQG
jgi:hypothetical protein